MNLAGVLSLARREWTRFLRQPSRSLSAAASPLLLWLVLGSGLDPVFRPPGGEGVGFEEYFFPGVLLLLLVYGALFANATVIQDRREGFLQGVMVAPLRPFELVLGKVLGGSVQGWAQGMLVLAAAPLAGLPLTAGRAVAAALVLALTALTLTAAGFALASVLDSLQGFHSLMNLVLVPLWLLSGAFFPQATAPTWLRLSMEVNPLALALAALRRALYPSGHPLVEGLAPAGPTLLFLAILSLALLTLGSRLVARRRWR